MPDQNLSLVTVWPVRGVPGWDGSSDDLQTLQVFPTIPLLDALQNRYTTDAHFWPGFLRNKTTGEIETYSPRINKSALKALEGLGLEVLFRTLVLDIDDPQAHKQATKTSPEWVAEHLSALLSSELGARMGYYQTMRGFRALWTVAKPLTIQEYIGFLSVLRSQVQQITNVSPDALSDFGRCYRLPFVVRDGKEQSLPMDVKNLGPLDLSLLSEKGKDKSATSPSAKTLTSKPSKTSSKTTFKDMAQVKPTRRPYEVPPQITQNRNIELTRVAGSLRVTGLSVEEILSALLTINQERCSPPLEEEEVHRIAESAGRWEPGKTRPTPLPEIKPASTPSPAEPSRTTSPLLEDDLSMYEIDYLGLPISIGKIGRLVQRKEPPAMATSAPRFTSDSDPHVAEVALHDLESHGHRCVYDRGELWRYHDSWGYWRPVPDRVSKTLICSYDGEMIASGTRPRPFMVTMRKVGSVLDAVRAGRDTPGWFDKEAAGLTFQNGFATVVNGDVALLGHHPRFRATRALDMVYRPGGRPSRFLAFLDSCFRHDPDKDEKIACLQEFVGACLMNEATRYQRGLVLIGVGANGKSTFLNIISRLFENRMITSIPPQDMSNEYRRAMLAGSRLNVVSELPESEIFSSEAVKAMISGDQVVARNIREAPFTFFPRAGHVFAANNLPNVTDLTDGFFRRWLIVSWDRTFAEHEQIKTLAEDIYKTELAEIATWALEGAARLQRNRSYTTPHSMESWVKEWRSNSDQVMAFLAARYIWPPLENGTPQSIPASELYADYHGWSLSNGHRPMTSTKFGKRVKNLGVPWSTNNRGTMYHLDKQLHVLEHIRGVKPR